MSDTVEWTSYPSVNPLAVEEFCRKHVNSTISLRFWVTKLSRGDARGAARDVLQPPSTVLSSSGASLRSPHIVRLSSLRSFYVLCAVRSLLLPLHVFFVFSPCRYRRQLSPRVCRFPDDKSSRRQQLVWRQSHSCRQLGSMTYGCVRCRVVAAAQRRAVSLSELSSP